MGLSFDAEDRATTAGAQSMTYLPDGTRGAETDNGVTGYFIYDGAYPIAQLNSTGVVANAMDYGANGYLGVHSAGKFTSYTEDPLGNAVQSVNSSYTLSSPQYPMGAFGTLGGTAYPSGYYGLQHNFNVGWNQSTGLLGLGARLYDPQTGRFINRDPMGYGGGMNLYGYADDDPVDGFDPTGTETFSQWYYGGDERV